MGVADQLVVDGVIVEALFNDRVRRREPVGMCGCGGLLEGRITRTRRMWFAEITCHSCGKETVAPDGKVGPRVDGPRDGVVAVDPVLARTWAERDAAVLGEREAAVA